MKSICCSVLLLCGCTLEWNGGTPSLPLVGSAPSLSSFDKLNTAPVGRASLMTGPDGVPWVAFCEFWGEGSGNRPSDCKRMHLTRLGPADDPAGDELLTADSFGLHGQMIYALTASGDKTSTQILLHRPGDPTNEDVSFTVPGTQTALFVNDGGAADVFVAWPEAATTTGWTVFRRDKRYTRTIPLPAGLDPTGMKRDGLVLALDQAGDRFIVRTPDESMTVYSTLDEGVVSLGPRAFNFFFDNAHDAIVTYGDDGVRGVGLDGSMDLPYTADVVVDPNSVALSLTDVFYATRAGLWDAPLDRSAPPRLVQPNAVRARAVGPHGDVVYGYDPSTLYAGNAGDGWLGDWKFMQRGRFCRFSADGQRLHFLENAATLSVYGDLTTATSPHAPVRTLSLNVHAYDELNDGRLLAIENAIQPGVWNRLVVIDEVAGERRWVVPSAAEFILLPGKTELIVDVVTGPNGYDILRVPAP
jgi:hypothetical protein